MLETRTGREIDEANGTLPRLKQSDRPIGWQVWTPATWARRAGVVPVGDKVVHGFNPTDDCAQWEAAGYRVVVDVEVGNIDIVDSRGRKVAQYTPQFDYTNK